MRILFWWSILALLPALAAAEGEVARLQAILDRTRTVEGRFLQTSEGQGVSGKEESSGRFWVSRPGRFRWDYLGRDPQEIVSDGEYVWYFEPELKQATRARTADLEKSPAALLAMKVKIEEVFTAESLDPAPWNGPAVRLVPREEGSLQEIVVLLHPQKEEILGLAMTDTLGVHSRFTYQEVVVNHDIPDRIFRFTPPEGTDILAE